VGSVLLRSVDPLAVLRHPVLDMDNDTVQNRADSVLKEEITPPRISTGKCSEYQAKTLILGLSATTNQIMCLLSVKCDRITSTKSLSFCVTNLTASPPTSVT